MSKFSLALSLALLMILASVALGDPEISYKTHVDENYGFSVDYPDLPEIFNQTDKSLDQSKISHFTLHSQTADGDGLFSLDIYGGPNTENQTAKDLLDTWTSTEEDQFGFVNGVTPIPGTAKFENDFFTLDYEDDSAGRICIKHVFGLANKDLIITYEMRYPPEEKAKFAKIAAAMDKSLKFGK
jgi:hypothetical protein